MTATSKTRSRKNNESNYQLSDNNKRVEVDAKFHNDLRSKSLSYAAAKRATRVVLCWKHDTKQKMCMLWTLECGKQDEIMQEVTKIGLFGVKCKAPEWNFEMSVKEKSTMLHIHIHQDI